MNLLKETDIRAANQTICYYYQCISIVMLALNGHIKRVSFLHRIPGLELMLDQPCHVKAHIQVSLTGQCGSNLTVVPGLVRGVFQRT